MPESLDPLFGEDPHSEPNPEPVEKKTEPTPADGPNIANGPVADETTHRGVQRRALRTLVALSTECSAEENTIEESHDAAVADAGRRYENGKNDAGRRYESLRGTVGQKYTTRVNELTGKHASEAANIAAADKKARQRADHEHDTAQRELKQKVQQAVWLAESVYEATQIQLREDSKKAKEVYENSVVAMDEYQLQAASLMSAYGQRLATTVPEVAPLPEGANSAAIFQQKRGEVEQHLSSLRRMKLPTFFVGLRPFLVVVLLCTAAGVGAQIYKGGMPPSLAALSTTQPLWQPIGVAAGATFVVLLIAGIALRIMSNKQVAAIYQPLRMSIAEAEEAARRQSEDARIAIEQKLTASTKKRDQEIKSAKDQHAPAMLAATRTRDTAKKAQQTEYAKQVAKLGALRDKSQADLDAWKKKHQVDLQSREGQDQTTHEENYKQETAQIEQKYQEDKASLDKKWNDGLANIQSGIGGEEDAADRAPASWSDPAWDNWAPPKKFATAIRFGELHVDLQQITNRVPRHLAIPPTFSVPALLAFPQHSSLLIETDRVGRPEAISCLQMVMSRLLTSLPAGRVRFTLIDPVGLGQNFAGFMHLSDYDDALVGSRIWTEAEQIDQRLADLTEHMETVIQKYLRNEFATIDDYNAQAGELAEPYRFLVIADFPSNFSAEAIVRLASIASTGARCGVYTLVMRDTRQTLPTGGRIDDLEAHSVVITQREGKFVWKDEVFKQFPLSLDPPPNEDQLTKILHVVGKGAKDAKRVEVPFSLIAPKPEQFWTSDSTSDLLVPIGRMGATRLQMMRLGRGVAQHCLIAGKTGSGKSTLLNAIITNLAMWYEPDQCELFLIDFKKGVEFKAYAKHALPHARAIAVESDREFGLSVLQRLDAELIRRGDMYRKVNSQDLAGYRKSPGAVPMPRMLLIIDEFQEFFTEDDRVAQEAGLLLDRLVRQGRAFGIHVLLGSQTIGGASGLARTTIGQMAVRVALACSEADSQLILGDNNSAARLLSRPGEAIYNDQGGLVEANSPFQIAWLSDDQREAFLTQVSERAKSLNGRVNAPIVFEGNAPAEVTKNPLMNNLIDAPTWPVFKGAAYAWLGDPVAIKDATAVAFRRQSGANVLIIGQQDDAALSMMAASMLSLAAQHAPDGAKFYVMDGTPADSPLAGTFDKIKAVIPHEVKMVDYRAVPDAMNELETEMKRRGEGELGEVPSIYVFVYGLQRYRALRKSEDSFGGFGSSDEDKKADPGKQFADMLKEGPTVGMHVMAWCDTPISVERTLDRTMMREFDNRVLFQMSANDSSNLIDSPAANKLGVNRALAYSEEQGVMEKFRPFGMPDGGWLEEIKLKFAKRAVTA